MPFELGGTTIKVQPHGGQEWKITIQNRLIGPKVFVASREIFTRTPEVGQYATVVSPTPLEDFAQIRMTKHRPKRMRRNDLNITLAPVGG